MRSEEHYGAFVELTPNLAGLAESRDGVEAGQQASVYIKSIIPEKMKIKLILVDAFAAEYPPAPPLSGSLFTSSPDSRPPSRIPPGSGSRGGSHDRC